MSSWNAGRKVKVETPEGATAEGDILRVDMTRFGPLVILKSDPETAWQLKHCTPAEKTLRDWILETLPERIGMAMVARILEREPGPCGAMEWRSCLEWGCDVVCNEGVSAMVEKARSAVPDMFHVDRPEIAIPLADQILCEWYS